MIKKNQLLYYTYIKYFKLPRQKPQKLAYKTNKNKIYVFLAADYNNLGDIAITEAQIEYLDKITSKKYEVVRVPLYGTFAQIKKIKKQVTNKDIITLIGGGNSGDLYPEIEIARIEIINTFRNNLIISFPQSVLYYDNSLLKRKFIKACRKHSNIHFAARESLSLSRYKKMNISAILVPDIVFSYNANKNLLPGKRSGISIVMRNDIEKSIDRSIGKAIVNICSNYDKVYYDDTCDIKYDAVKYKTILDSYVKKISTRKLIITDRLHGMIMSYITKTPCIVFDNNNHKIKYTYNDWLKNGQNFIILLEQSDIKYLDRYIKKLTSCDFKTKYVDISAKMNKIDELFLQ